MRSAIFIILVIALALCTYFNIIPWYIPALVALFFVIAKYRQHNFAQLKERKIHQTTLCCQELGISDEQVKEWFNRPEWQEKENYMDVHPGREAKAIAEAYGQSSKPAKAE